MIFNKEQELKDLVTRLNRLVTLSGKSARAYAIDAGVNPSTMQRYCAGDRSPEIINLLHLCKYHGVSLDWLCGLSQTQKLDDDRARRMFEAYSQASPQDRGIIEILLSKYGYSK